MGKGLYDLVDEALEQEKPRFYGMFRVLSANATIEEAKTRPLPTPLYRTLWYDGELCCLFGDSNCGKSILAVQIGDFIAHSGKKVLYFDFEMSDSQFSIRYTNKESQFSYTFPDSVLRVEICDFPENGNFEENVIKNIEETIYAENANVAIIDNITYLCAETEKGDSAIRLMRRLKEIKKKHKISMLVLAHTPKRNKAFPLTPNDLAGSKNLFNFYDSAFAVGVSSKDENLRYIKQLKCRNGGFEHSSDNVIVCDIQKDDSFLKFQFVEYAEESEHLKALGEEDKETLKNKVLERIKNGESLRHIASELNISVGKVQRIKNASG